MKHCLNQMIVRDKVRHFIATSDSLNDDKEIICDDKKPLCV